MWRGVQQLMAVGVFAWAVALAVAVVTHARAQPRADEVPPAPRCARCKLAPRGQLRALRGQLRALRGLLRALWPHCAGLTAPSAATVGVGHRFGLDAGGDCRAAASLSRC